MLFPPDQRRTVDGSINRPSSDSTFSAPHPKSTSRRSKNPCWICSVATSTRLNPLLRDGVCKCSGSTMPVHQKCIDELVFSYGYQKCNLCNSYYQVDVSGSLADFCAMPTWKKWWTIFGASFHRPRVINRIPSRIIHLVLWMLFSHVVVPYAVGAVYYRDTLLKLVVAPSLPQDEGCAALGGMGLVMDSRTTDGIQSSVSLLGIIWKTLPAWVLGTAVGMYVRILWSGWKWWKTSFIPGEREKDERKRREKEEEQNKNHREGEASEGMKSESDLFSFGDDSSSERSETEDTDEEEKEMNAKNSENEERKPRGPLLQLLKGLSAIEEQTGYPELHFTTTLHFLIGSLLMFVLTASTTVQYLFCLHAFAGLVWVHHRYPLNVHAPSSISSWDDVERIELECSYTDHVRLYAQTAARIMFFIFSVSMGIFFSHIILSPFITFWPFSGRDRVHVRSSFTNGEPSLSSSSPSSLVSTPWDTVLEEFTIFRFLFYEVMSCAILTLCGCLEQHTMVFLFADGVNLLLLRSTYIPQTDDRINQARAFVRTLTDTTLTSLISCAIFLVGIVFIIVMLFLIPFGISYTFPRQLWSDRFAVSWSPPSQHAMEVDVSSPFDWREWKATNGPCQTSPFSSAVSAPRPSSRPFSFYNNAFRPAVSLAMTKMMNTMVGTFVVSPSLSFPSLSSSEASSPASLSDAQPSTAGGDQGGRKEEHWRNELGAPQIIPPLWSRAHHTTPTGIPSKVIQLPLSLARFFSHPSKPFREEMKNGNPPIVVELVDSLLRKEHAPSVSVVRDMVQKELKVLLKENGFQMILKKGNEVEEKNEGFFSAFERFRKSSRRYISLLVGLGLRRNIYDSLWAFVVIDSLFPSYASLETVSHVLEMSAEETSSFPFSFLPVGRDNAQQLKQTDPRRMLLLFYKPLKNQTFLALDVVHHDVYIYKPSSLFPSLSLPSLFKTESLGLPHVTVCMTFLGHLAATRLHPFLYDFDRWKDARNRGINQTDALHNAAPIRSMSFLNPRHWILAAWRSYRKVFGTLWWGFCHDFMDFSQGRWTVECVWTFLTILTAEKCITHPFTYAQWMKKLVVLSQFWGRVWNLSPYLFAENTHSKLKEYIELVKISEIQGWDPRSIVLLPSVSSFECALYGRTDVMPAQQIPRHINLKRIGFFFCFIPCAIFVHWEKVGLWACITVCFTTDVLSLFTYPFIISMLLFHPHCFFRDAFFPSLKCFATIIFIVTFFLFAGPFSLLEAIPWGRLADSIFIYAKGIEPHVVTVARRNGTPRRSKSY